MAANPRISLDQWRALVAVVDAGGYAAAAKSLHKSQSAMTYAVQTIESLLRVKPFEIRGRRAALTPAGQLLYERARVLIDEAAELERAANRASAGWESEITVTFEIVFPTWLLLKALDRFGREAPHTRIEVIESVLEGASELVVQRRVDLAITPIVPSGFLAELVTRLRFVPAAHPDHPLFKLKRPLTMRDLRKHRHLVIRDTSTKRDKRVRILQAEQRWTVGHMATSLQAARMGFGFAWYPEEKIREELAAGQLKVLPVKDGGERFADMYLVLADSEGAGPGVRRLAEIIKSEAAESCKGAAALR